MSTTALVFIEPDVDTPAPAPRHPDRSERQRTTRGQRKARLHARRARRHGAAQALRTGRWDTDAAYAA